MIRHWPAIFQDCTNNEATLSAWSSALLLPVHINMYRCRYSVLCFYSKAVSVFKWRFDYSTWWMSHPLFRTDIVFGTYFHNITTQTNGPKHQKWYLILAVAGDPINGCWLSYRQGLGPPEHVRYVNGCRSSSLSPQPRKQFAFSSWLIIYSAELWKGKEWGKKGEFICFRQSPKSRVDTVIFVSWVRVRDRSDGAHPSWDAAEVSWFRHLH